MHLVTDVLYEDLQQGQRGLGLFVHKIAAEHAQEKLQSFIQSFIYIYIFID